MEIRKIGEPLELAIERVVRVSIDGISFDLECTPTNLDDLILGFLVTQGFREVKVEDAKISISEALPEPAKKVTAKEKYSIKELKNALKYLEVEEYKRTRGYHIAAIVDKNGLVARAYDVSRHSAVDKVVGMCVRKKVPLSKTFLLFSGRISRGIVLKCIRAGIPLVTSKAAILDSAIELCRKTGLSAVSFATNIAVIGDALEI